MSNWIMSLVLAFLIFEAAFFLWWTIRLNRELKSSLVFDCGPQPNRVGAWTLIVLVAFFVWIQWGDEPELNAVLMCLMNGLLGIRSVLGSIPHQGIYENGVFLGAKFLWIFHGYFIRWSDIQNYRWEEPGQLVVKTAWSPYVLRISEDRIVDLKAFLREKCPDAELEIPLEKP